MIDFHCHVDLYPHPAQIISTSEDRGVYVLAVTTTPKSWKVLKTLIGDSKRVRAAIGLHPELVGERSTEVEEVCAIIPATRYVGEIGLDGTPKCKPFLDLQKEVFKKILRQCENVGGKILSIHSRKTTTDVLDALESYPQAGTPVLHWFSGTEKELKRAIEMKAWFSVGLPMLTSQKGRELVKLMPRAHVLTESDGPFVSDDSGPLLPWQMDRVEVLLADTWSVPVKEVRRILTDNLRNLVRQGA